MRFLAMEADEQREFLGEELAEWHEAGFWTPARVAVFHRRVRILARSIGTTHADLMETLEADAEAIRAARSRTVEKEPST